MEIKPEVDTIPDIACDICQNRGFNEAADHWCKPCKVFMCKSCVAVHNSFRNGDLLIPIEDILELKRNEKDIDVICTVHKLKLELYCAEHEYLGCPECIEAEHNQCEDVKRIDEYDVQLKDSNEIKIILEKFSEYLEILQKVKTDSTIKKSNLLQERERIKTEISEFRQKINRLIDQAEVSALQKLDEIIETEETTISEKIVTSEDLLEKVEKSKKTLEIAISLQEEILFLPILIKSLFDVSYLTGKIDHVSKNGREDRIAFEPSTLFVDLINNFEPLGSVSALTDGKNEEEGSVDSDETDDHDNRSFLSSEPKADLVKTINVCLPTDGYSRFRITGGLYLGQGRLLLCDFENRKLKMFHEDGVLMTEMPLISNPWDICRVDKSTVAVTQPVGRMISLVTIDDDVMQITSSISTELKVFGIGMSEGKFIITSAEEKEGQLQVYDPEEKTFSTVSKNEKGQDMFSGNPYHLRINPRTADIVVSQFNFKSDQARGFILDKDLKLIRTIMDDDLDVAYGVDFDKYDNLYICGRDSAKVKCMSSDGSSSAILVERKDVHAIICWDDKFLLASDFNDTVHIYKVQL